MESIEKLREWSHRYDNEWVVEDGVVMTYFHCEPDYYKYPKARNVGEAFRDLADEIEREVAEKYMELPVDADGVPWHVGEVTENGNRINAMTVDRVGWHFTDTLNDIDPSIHTHYRPRNIEDVLRDVRNMQSDDDGEDALIAFYVDELRKMGVGE